jgi:hypothetical protein
MKVRHHHSYGRRALSVLFLSALMAQASAATRQHGLPRYGVAVYSDLCIEQDSGDIGGQRISVHRFAEGDSVFYEFTAGALSWPVVASDVEINDGTGVLTFTVEGQDGQQRTVIGRFSTDGETLTLDGGYCADASMPMRLAKVRDFGRKLKSCRACPVAAPAQVAPAAEAPSIPVPAQEPDSQDAPMEKNEAPMERNEPVQPTLPAPMPPASHGPAASA